MCNQMVTVEIKEFSLEFCPNYDYFPPPNAREIMTIWTMGKSSYSLISTVSDKKNPNITADILLSKIRHLSP